MRNTMPAWLFAATVLSPTASLSAPMTWTVLSEFGDRLGTVVVDLDAAYLVDAVLMGDLDLYDRPSTFIADTANVFVGPYRAFDYLVAFSDATGTSYTEVTGDLPDYDYTRTVVNDAKIEIGVYGSAMRGASGPIDVVINEVLSYSVTTSMCDDYAYDYDPVTGDEVLIGCNFSSQYTDSNLEDGYYYFGQIVPSAAVPVPAPLALLAGAVACLAGTRCRIR